MQLISERAMEVKFFYFIFSHWRSYSLQPNSSAQGSTKLIKIAFSQSSRYGSRGWGFRPFPSRESNTGHVFHLGEGTMTLGTIASWHLPLHQCSHSGRDSEGEAALVRRKALSPLKRTGAWLSNKSHLARNDNHYHGKNSNSS